MDNATKISIIIPDNSDRTYLIRCLNSIKRQTYQNIEIFLVGNDYPSELKEEYDLSIIPVTEIKEENEIIISQTADALNQCLDKSTGKYLYLYNMNSVGAPNLFQELLEVTENNEDADQTFFTARLVYNSKDQYADIARPRLYYEGKLFSMDAIRNGNLSFTSDSLLSPVIFTMEYLSGFSNIEIMDSLYVYMKEPISSVLNQIPDVDRIEFVEELYKLFKDERDFVYDNIKSNVKPYYKKSIDNKDEELYEKLKEFLMMLSEDERFLKACLKLLAITPEQFEFMKDNNLSDYSFYKDKLIKESIGDKQIVSQIELLEKTIKALEGSIKTLEKTSELQQRAIANYEESLNRINNDYNKLKESIETINVPQAAPVVMEVKKELSGQELIDATLENYRNGKLGLKTIFRSLGAWLKHKFGGKK